MVDLEIILLIYDLDVGFLVSGRMFYNWRCSCCRCMVVLRETMHMTDS